MFTLGEPVSGILTGSSERRSNSWPPLTTANKQEDADSDRQLGCTAHQADARTRRAWALILPNLLVSALDRYCSLLRGESYPRGEKRLGTGSHVGLIGDIGGTDARFALVSECGNILPARVYSLHDYSSLAEAIDHFLADEAPDYRPSSAVLAVASPVMGDQITLTNHHAWTFSIEDLRQHLRLTQLRVMNDFTATALAVPHLEKTGIF